MSSSLSTVFHVWDSVLILLQLYTANTKKACSVWGSGTVYIPSFPKSLLKSSQLPQTFGENHFQIQFFYYLEIKILHCVFMGQRDSLSPEQEKRSLLL